MQLQKNPNLGNVYTSVYYTSLFLHIFDNFHMKNCLIWWRHIVLQKGLNPGKQRDAFTLSCHHSTQNHLTQKPELFSLEYFPFFFTFYFIFLLLLSILSPTQLEYKPHKDRDFCPRWSGLCLKSKSWADPTVKSVSRLFGQSSFCFTCSAFLELNTLILILPSPASTAHKKRKGRTGQVAQWLPQECEL